jgi:PKD repeat protein
MNIIMRTLKLSLVAAIATTTIAACTVKDVDTPPLAGPSSLARTIIMFADRDAITQDGSDFATIDIRAQVQPGQSENVRLRAQVFVDGVAQDFGTLSNKSPITPTTITYRAPAAPTTAAGQVPTTVTIAVTPFDSGDFRGETTRTIDLRLIPPGVILPTNPNLVAAFDPPPSPKVMDLVTFDASTTTNNGVACNTLCTYAWDFGDGTSATGQITTHQFRTVGTFLVRLTVTDVRGATATTAQAVTVAPGTPPSAVFTRSPSGDVGVNQSVFFDASASTPAAGRSIVRYDWNFGDGNFAQGVIVSHSYAAAGVYSGQLITTDDAGSKSAPAAIAVTAGQSSGPVPTAAMTCTSPTAPSRTASCNASASRPGSGSNIESYTFNWGDGSPEEVVANPIQTHTYTAAGTLTVTMTVRDTLGRTATTQATVTIP